MDAGPGRVGDRRHPTMGRQHQHDLRRSPSHREVRFVRVTAEPASEKCSVYFAEIEVIGTDDGEPPALTAIAGSRSRRRRRRGNRGRDRWRAHRGARRRQDANAGRADVGAPITALAGSRTRPATGPQSVVYGASHDLLGLIAPDGEKVKEIHIPQYRGIPSEPQNITVADLDGDGVASIVVGVRSWQYLAYSPQLELEWNNVIYAHSATVAEVADLDGDGTQGDGGRQRLLPVEHHQQRRETPHLCRPVRPGTVGRDQRGPGRRRTPRSRPGHRWRRRARVRSRRQATVAAQRRGPRDVLGPVTLRGKTGIVAASESGYVWAFDAGGEPLWRTTLGEPVRRLIPSGDTLVCAASGAGVVVLSRSGTV